MNFLQSLISLFRRAAPVHQPAPTVQEDTDMTQTTTTQMLPALPIAHLTAQDVHATVLANLASVQSRQQLAAELAAKVKAEAAKLVAQAGPVISTLVLPQTTAPAEGETPTAQVTVTSTGAAPATLEADMATFIADYLPSLATTSQALFTGKFSIAEVEAEAKALREAVSYIVAVGLPAAKGMNAEVLVSVLLGWALDTYAGPLMMPFLYSMFKPIILNGIKWVYETRVKPKVAGQ